MDPRSRFAPLVLIAWLALSLTVLTFAPAADGEDNRQVDDQQVDAMRLFEERIMPIFRSPKPSSCVQCHLASVDIKDYILPSHTETFLALREQGLIDLQQPAQSKILTLIRMGEKDADPGARMIHEKTRRAEFEAFSAWIQACCQDETLTSVTTPSVAKTVGPEKPLEVVRHGRKSRLVESFTRNIWSQRMRCFPCHTPHEIDPENPNHQVPAQRHREFVEKYGAKMNLFAETPEATLTQLVAGSRHPKAGRYPMINLEDPTKSLLVLKPTSKLPAKLADGGLAEPSSSDPVSHMGGLKMHVNDHSYKAFVSWIADYAAVVGDRYLTSDDLPADNWVPTERVLKVLEVPESWGQLSIVQLFVHGKDKATNGWSAQPIAFTQGIVTPRRIVNGPLFLIRSDSGPTETELSESEFPLKPGEYLVKAYVDSKNRMADSPTLLLDETDYVGEAVIDAQWQIGFPKAETISAAMMTKP